MILRKASFDDVSDVMRILTQARQAQRVAGFRQWDDGFPSPDVVKADISNGIGYILDDGGVAAGYVAIARHDEEYDRHPVSSHCHSRRLQRPKTVSHVI